MRYTYEAIFEKDKTDGGYNVQFPDIPEICTQGDDLPDAIFMASDALELWIASCAIDGDDLAQPTFGHKAKDGMTIAVSVYPRPEYEVIEYVTTTDAASYLGVTQGRIRQMIREGKLIAKKSGRDNMVDFASVESIRANPLKVGRPKALAS